MRIFPFQKVSQDVAENIHTKIFQMKKNMVKLRIHELHRTGSNETALVSEIPYIINYENVIIAPGQGKDPVLILGDEFCEEQAFLYLLPKGKFDYKAPQDIPISPAWYFNQRLLAFNQYFASDKDYIFCQVCM